ncbi:hypothetical protein KY290_020824 [Solanum tuberosum]|uniref:Uncharacterized protein n=1 Tax=Solanum tuberosum TaxID=4113 RepID=A0ABQ7UZS2_SOLTU|nr:hypothetical protein KY285_019795 [Solanum tuberosum]KAH0757331.1 hypothetical protein KY290_020824 [Solanum tuberosum]
MDPLGSSGLIPLAGYRMLWQREVDHGIIAIALCDGCRLEKLPQQLWYFHTQQLWVFYQDLLGSPLASEMEPPEEKPAWLGMLKTGKVFEPNLDILHEQWTHPDNQTKRKWYIATYTLSQRESFRDSWMANMRRIDCEIEIIRWFEMTGKIGNQTKSLQVIINKWYAISNKVVESITPPLEGINIHVAGTVIKALLPKRKVIRQVYNKIHEMGVAITAYKMRGSTDREVATMIAAGFTEMLKHWWDYYCNDETKHLIINATAMETIERFISGLPPLFVDNVRTKIQDCNDGRIPYSQLTYGDLTGHKASECRSSTMKKKINLLGMDEETKGKLLAILDEPFSESSGTSDEYSDDEDIDLDYESDISQSGKNCTCTEVSNLKEEIKDIKCRLGKVEIDVLIDQVIKKATLQEVDSVQGSSQGNEDDSINNDHLVEPIVIVDTVVQIGTA